MFYPSHTRLLSTYSISYPPTYQVSTYYLPHIYLSIICHPSIICHLSLCQSIIYPSSITHHLSVHPSPVIYLSVYLYHPSIHHPSSVHPSITCHLSMYLYHPSIHPSIIHHLSIHPSPVIYLSICPSSCHWKTLVLGFIQGEKGGVPVVVQ